MPVRHNQDMKLSLENLCDSVIRWSLNAIFFLTPIFFLPVTLYPVDLNKQILFISLTLIATVAFLAKTIKQGKVEYAKSYTGVPLAALVIFVIISAFFSGARSIGFMGVSGGETDTVIAVIGFALFYFLISVSFKEKESIVGAFTMLMASATLAVVAALPAMFNAFTQFIGYPLPVWNFVSVNAVGTSNAFGLYIGFVAMLSFGVFQYLPTTKRVHMWAGALAFSSFLLTLLIGYFAIFIGLAISLSIFTWFDAQRRFIPFIGIVITVCMFIIGTGVITIPVPRIDSSVEVAPSIGASFRIAQMTARESVRSFLLGSGPATYQYQYGKYRDADLNATQFWDVRFTQGFDGILTNLTAWGVLGTILLLLFLVGVVSGVIRMVRSRRIDPVGSILTVLTAYLILALILYPQNFTLYFLLFAIAGCVTAYNAQGKGGLGTLAAWQIVCMFAIVAACALLYVNSKRYVAGIVFARGIAVATETKDIEQALPLLIKGASLDPENDEYLKALASAYLAHGNALAAKAGTTPDADTQKKVAEAVSLAVAAAERATQVNPESVQNWIGLAQMYGAVASFNENAASSVFAIYQKAQSLEPLNPAIATYLGAAHRAAAVRMKSGNASEYAAALTAYEAALALKPDYVPAHFAIIEMLDSEGRGDEALTRAERLRILAVNAPEILFQLGAIHYQADRFSKAQEVLEQAVRISPDYANALYFLGLAYEKQGDYARALTQFERVAKLNPQNTEVQKIIDDLRKK